MPASYQRLIYHYGPDAETPKGLLSQDALDGCWFEIYRKGGCGPGELSLSHTFENRQHVEIGDWIAFEPTLGVRWYFGRVQERIATSPAGVTLRLEGMSAELGEVYPGGFGMSADGRKPHRYGAGGLFSDDPDYSIETYDSATRSDEIIKMMLDQYIVSRTHIEYETTGIEQDPVSGSVQSLKFRGEESALAIIKELAIRAKDASWGVDAYGKFFFLQRNTTVVSTCQEGHNVTNLIERKDATQIFNRIVLTGDYVYDRKLSDEQKARRSFRWRGNYYEPDSCAQHGEKRIRLWIPWIRTQEDSRSFAQEFFQTYSQGATRYQLELVPNLEMPWPWLGTVELKDRAGNVLIKEMPERIKVSFDHAAIFEIELGAEDPRVLWSEPEQDERWELPENYGQGFGGGGVELPGAGGGGGGNSTPSSSSLTNISTDSSSLASEESSDHSSEISSEEISSLAHSSDVSFGQSSTGDFSAQLSSVGNSILTSEDISEEISSHTFGPGGSTAGSGNSGGGGSGSTSQLMTSTNLVSSSDDESQSDESSLEESTLESTSSTANLSSGL